jgi:GTPase SAR1 family protein
MTRSFYQSAHGAVIVCDASKPETMDGAVKWRQDLTTKMDYSIPCVLAMNKSDLGPCSVGSEGLTKWAQANHFEGWLPTSAKTRMNVEEMFRTAVKHVMKANPGTAASAASSPSHAATKLQRKPQVKEDKCTC